MENIFTMLINGIMENLVYIAPVLLPIMWWYGGGKNFDYEGINYHPFSDTSYPNPTYQIKGNKWTENRMLKRLFSENKERSLKFDNFDYSTYFYKKNISFLKKMFLKKAEIYINPLKLCESVVMVSPMGGGKTVTLDSLINQPWYNRALIHEAKTGDSYKKWGNSRKDISFCPYDERAHVWDILSEDTEIVEFFIQNTINSVTGGNQSFFTNDAKERYIQLAQLTIDIEDPKEKWNYFINEIEAMFKEVEEEDSKSAKDVVATMKQVVKMLKLIRFQLEAGKKSFTINDFFKRKYQSKLFMVKVEKYNTQLKVLYTAFTACFAMIHASQAETKTDLTFYCLDEYLDLDMTFEAKHLLHTKIRSKGGALLTAMQYLPEEEKFFNLITSSAYAYFIFSVKNIKTRNFFDEQVGKRDYMIRKTINAQFQENKESENILDWAEVDRLGKDHKHIVYMPQEGSLFVAKSDFIDKKEINKDFILDESIEDFKRYQNKEYLDKKEKKAAISEQSKEYAKKGKAQKEKEKSA